MNQKFIDKYIEILSFFLTWKISSETTASLTAAFVPYGWRTGISLTWEKLLFYIAQKFQSYFINKLCHLQS